MVDYSNNSNNEIFFDHVELIDNKFNQDNAVNNFKLKHKEYNFKDYKIKLKNIIKSKIKKENKCFEEIIANYKQLLIKNKALKEKLNLFEKDSISNIINYNNIKTTMLSSSKLNSKDYELNFKSIENNFNNHIDNSSHNSKLNSCNIEELINKYELKIISLDDKLSNASKDNKELNKDLLKYVTELSNLKENITNKKQQIEMLSNKLASTEISLQKSEENNDRLEIDIQILKTNNANLEKINIEISTKLKDKIIENNNLINELLTIKNDYAIKMNEMIEMFDEAKKKKEAADTYYNNKKDIYKSAMNYKSDNKFSELNLIMNDVKIMVEESKIPNKLKFKLPAHKKSINEIYFNPFGTNFLTCSSDHFIRNWDATKNNEIGIYTGFGSGVTGVCYDQSEQLMFACSLDRSAKLWDLRTSKMLASFSGHIDYINSATTAYSSKRGFTGSSDRTLKEWDFEQRKLVKTYSNNSGVFSTCMSNNDNYIYSGHADGSIKIWSVNFSDKPEQILDIHYDTVLSIKNGKNDYQILTLSKDYSIKLIDIRNSKEIYTLDSNIIPNYCECPLSLTIDKKYFATGSTKGDIYIFNTETGELADKIDNKSKCITSIQWRPYHSQIYVGDITGMLTIWGH